MIAISCIHPAVLNSTLPDLGLNGRDEAGCASPSLSLLSMAALRRAVP